MNTSSKKTAMLLASQLITSSVDPWVFIAAFAGSIIFCVSDKKHSHWTTVALFTSSMIIGITSSDFVAALLSYFISHYTGLHLTVPGPVGATVSAAISVRLLMYINGQQNKDDSFLSRIVKGLKK